MVMRQWRRWAGVGGRDWRVGAGNRRAQSRPFDRTQQGDENGRIPMSIAARISEIRG